MSIARSSCLRVSLLCCDSFRFRRWSASSGQRVWMPACASWSFCFSLARLDIARLFLFSLSSSLRSPISVFTDSRLSFWYPVAPFFRRLWTCCAPRSARMRVGAVASMRFRRVPGLSLRRSSAAVLILRRLRGGISDRLSAIPRRMTRVMRRSWGGG